MKECTAVLLRLFIILSPFPADGFVLQMYQYCRSEGAPQNMNFTYQLVFNKQTLVSYSPDVQSFTPCPEGPESCIPEIYNLSSDIATILNLQSKFVQWMGRAAQACSSNAQRFWGDTARRTSPPAVRIAHIDPVNTRDPVMLACYVSDFYPKPINVTWMKNGDSIVSNVTESHTVLPNGDWTYQTQVLLELTPQSGDVYGCWVQHMSLGDPIVEEWKPQLQQIKISISVVVLVLGLIVLLAGLIRWKRSHTEGYIPIAG